MFNFLVLLKSLTALALALLAALARDKFPPKCSVDISWKAGSPLHLFPTLPWSSKGHLFRVIIKCNWGNENTDQTIPYLLLTSWSLLTTSVVTVKHKYLLKYTRSHFHTFSCFSLLSGEAAWLRLVLRGELRFTNLIKTYTTMIAGYLLTR